jgi:hypothetical protein
MPLSGLPGHCRFRDGFAYRAVEISDDVPEVLDQIFEISPEILGDSVPVPKAKEFTKVFVHGSHQGCGFPPRILMGPREAEVPSGLRYS